MNDDILTTTAALEPTFLHLECVHCEIEATLFRRVCAERDRLAEQLRQTREAVHALLILED